MVVILILAICLLLGMVLESMLIVVLMVPVVAPLPISLDINLVWFGILLVVATEISLITPPVGMNVFVLNILKTARPDWQFSTYRAYVGEYPDRVAACDGYVISGSPASINAQDGWIGEILDSIRILEC